MKKMTQICHISTQEKKKGASNEYVPECLCPSVCMYVCVFCTIEHSLILQEKLLWMQTCHSFQIHKLQHLK
jgi:hypothetical protein